MARGEGGAEVTERSAERRPHLLCVAQVRKLEVLVQIEDALIRDVLQREQDVVTVCPERGQLGSAAVATHRARRRARHRDGRLRNFIIMVCPRHDLLSDGYVSGLIVSHCWSTNSSYSVSGLQRSGQGMVTVPLLSLVFPNTI